MNKLLQDIKDNKNIIIIADNDYLPLLLKYKDTKANIKLMPYNKAISSLTFEINEAMIATLIKNGTEYTKAKQILSNLQLLTNQALSKAPKVLLDAYKLVKPLFTNTGYDPSYIFKNKEIYLFNAKDDIQLINLFKSKGLIVNHLSIDDLNIKQDFKNDKVVVNFDNKLEQYFYIFADIRKRLIANPELNKNIRIIGNDMYDTFYANYMSAIFGIDIYLNITMPLYNQPNVIKALKYFYEHKSLDLSILKDKDPATLELVRIIKFYELDKLEFEKGYLNLVEALVQTEYLDQSLDNKGVIVTNEHTFDDNYITYITCYQDDIFYESFKDVDVITDTSKKELGINPSYIKTLINKQKMSLFTLVNNNVLFSRVKQHLNEHIYDSGLIEVLGLEQRNFNYTNEDDLKELLSKNFTDPAANTLASILKDRGYDMKKFQLVEAYSNQPIGLKVKPKESYSITDIQDYNKCPFKYLLDHELHMSSSDDKYFANLGTLIHSVLEHVDDNEFNYDDLYAKAYEKFKNDMVKTSNGPYDPKYDVFVLIAKKWFKTIVDEYRYRLKELPNVKLLKEVKFDFHIPESEYSFNGKIDALMISKFNNKAFYSIVDYKTGSDEFAPLAVCVGQNIQLPMYFGGISHSDQEQLVAGMQKGGFGLKRILGNYPKKYTNGKHELTIDNLNDYIRANIYGCNDVDYEQSLKIPQQDTQMVALKNKNGVLKVNIGGVECTYDIMDLVKQAHRIAIESIGYMQDSNYPVVRTPNVKNVFSDKWGIKKEDTNCKYCKFADICYRDARKDYYDTSEKVFETWKDHMKGADNE